MKFVFAALAVVLAPALASARTFTIYNNCGGLTVWPAYFTSSGPAPTIFGQTNGAYGWQLNPYASTTVSVPNGWSGRFWGRRNCNFAGGSTLPSTCETGGCNGGLVCSASSGTGVPPTTLAEFTLNAGQNAGTDYYDVSIVDGWNLPVRISNTASCPAPSCSYDFLSDCPSVLRVGSSGCNSACNANLNPPPYNSPNCCSGQYDTPATCPKGGVQYYNYFKSHCSNYYAYAYDESSESALWTCPAGNNADYTVTFCP